jgi:formylmethanofuran:tetrahydromethanopterin formyltransferase
MVWGGRCALKGEVKAVMQLVSLIAPFHGRIVASGSKPGADTHMFMQTATNQRFAPTLKSR